MDDREEFLQRRIDIADRQFHSDMNQMWKIIFTSVTCATMIVGYQEGYTDNSPWWTHLTYIICHANIFHLGGNLLCLWLMKNRLHVPEALLITFMATWLPTPVVGMTMGLSGVLFAIAGMQWGKIHNWKGMLKYCGVAVLITMILPHCNWAVHAYCLMMGFAYGWHLGRKSKELWR